MNRLEDRQFYLGHLNAPCGNPGSAARPRIPFLILVKNQSHSSRTVPCSASHRRQIVFLRIALPVPLRAHLLGVRAAVPRTEVASTNRTYWPAGRTPSTLGRSPG